MRRSVKKSVVRRARKKRPKTFLEKRIEEWLKKAGYEVKPEFAIGQCHVDFLVNGTLIVEAQGCYWHGCSRCNEKLSKRQKSRRLKDKKRFEFKRIEYDIELAADKVLRARLERNFAHRLFIGV